MTTFPARRVPAALRHLRTVTSSGALAGVLVGSALTATSPGAPEGTLVVDPGPIAPVVRELPVPAGAGALPVTERLVSAAEEDGHDGHEAHGHTRVAAGRAVASLSVPRTREFSMLGVTWADPRAGQDVVVEVRTRGEQGWSAWEQLHIESAGPADTPGVRGGTEPIWVGKARGAQVRVGGARPRGLELSLIDPGEGPDLSLQSSVSRPGIITRRQWGADERLTEPCSSGLYGRTTEAVTIHHTVNSNAYEKWQSDDLVRGILAYHTQSNGWCDLGYNFLVDRYGQIFQGRRGSMERPVWGAHAGHTWVNEQSTGISLIGNFENTAPTPAMKRAAVALASWRLDAYYRNPQGRANIVGETYPVVMGHRDVKSTACPGRHAYAWLPTMREAVAARVDAETSPIERRWRAAGGQSGWMGWPRVGEHSVNGGRRTSFRSADLFWHPDTGAHEVHGAIRGSYLRHRHARGVLGFPTRDELSGRVPGSHIGVFQRGRIYHSSGTGAREVHGLILRKYLRIGGETSSVGLPTSDEESGELAGVAVSTFQRGAIYHHRSTGQRVVRGAILAKYLRLGADGGVLGLPTSDELSPGLSGRIHLSEFQRGRIYHSRATGAHEVHGRIGAKYVALGAHNSRLGLPVTDEFPVTGGARSNFERGHIVWDRRQRRAIVTYTS